MSMWLWMTCDETAAYLAERRAAERRAWAMWDRKRRARKGKK